MPNKVLFDRVVDLVVDKTFNSLSSIDAVKLDIHPKLSVVVGQFVEENIKEVGVKKLDANMPHEQLVKIILDEWPNAFYFDLEYLGVRMNACRVYESFAGCLDLFDLTLVRADQPLRGSGNPVFRRHYTGTYRYVDSPHLYDVIRGQYHWAGCSDIKGAANLTGAVDQILSFAVSLIRDGNSLPGTLEASILSNMIYAIENNDVTLPKRRIQAG